MTLVVPRLELWGDLECNSGKRLSTGGFIDSWFNGDITTSEEGEESFTYDIPIPSEAASVVSEGQVTRAWWSGSRYEEWLVRKVTKRRDTAGIMEVKCGPVSYRLAEHGFVQEWQVTPQNGKPILDVGLSKVTLHDVFQTYLVDNPFVTAVIPYLQIGSIPSEIASVTFDLSWSFATAQAVINDAVTAAQTALGKPYIWRFIRNSNTSYDITLYAATA